MSFRLHHEPYPAHVILKQTKTEWVVSHNGFQQATAKDFKGKWATMLTAFALHNKLQH